MSAAASCIREIQVDCLSSNDASWVYSVARNMLAYGDMDGRVTAPHESGSEGHEHVEEDR